MLIFPLWEISGQIQENSVFERQERNQFVNVEIFWSGFKLSKIENKPASSNAQSLGDPPLLALALHPEIVYVLSTSVWKVDTIFKRKAAGPLYNVITAVIIYEQGEGCAIFALPSMA